MRAVFDKGELLVLLRDFYELTGLRTVVVALQKNKKQIENRTEK